jgi:hypothetical protein
LSLQDAMAGLGIRPSGMSNAASAAGVVGRWILRGLALPSMPKGPRARQSAEPPLGDPRMQAALARWFQHIEPAFANATRLRADPAS